MKNLLIILISIILFSISCRTNAEKAKILNENLTEIPKRQADINPTSTPELQPDDINLKIGIVEGGQETICFRTKNGDLAKNTSVSIVTSLYESPQKILSAKVKRKLTEKCSRYASETTDKNPGENFYYLLTLTDKKIDENQEVFGIGVIEPKNPVRIKSNLASVDLNNDGKDEFFRRCTEEEGILLAIWTGKPLEGKRLWYSFYYLDYNVEPSCKDKDWEGIDDQTDLEITL